MELVKWAWFVAVVLPGELTQLLSGEELGSFTPGLPLAPVREREGVNYEDVYIHTSEKSMEKDINPPWCLFDSSLEVELDPKTPPPYCFRGNFSDLERLMGTPPGVGVDLEVPLSSW